MNDSRLTFIVPLRAKYSDSDWKLISKLCVNTIRSCLKNPSRHIKVIVIGHDKPNGHETIKDLRYEFIYTTTSRPENSLGPKGMEDKWDKLLFGLVRISKNPPDYFMFVDADDLVSAKIYDYLNTNRPKNGLIFKDGWQYQLGSKNIKLVLNRFNCGSNAVINTRSINLPLDSSMTERKRCLALCAGHTIIEREMQNANKPLFRAPFPAVIYVKHVAQHSSDLTETSHDLFGKAKALIKKRIYQAVEIKQYRSARKILRDFIDGPIA